MRWPWNIDASDDDFSLALRLPLDALSIGYRGGAALHRALYERGVLHPRKLRCCVVGVGSLTVGGACKTPMASWLAAQLLGRGHRVVLASRGYKRLGRGATAIVSDGTRVRSLGPEVGDEALVLVSRAPGVPVLIGRDRGLVGLRAISTFDCDVLVLDDGFQHHRLHRDIDLAVFEGSVGLGSARVLPRGPLREGLGALARATAQVVVDGPMPAHSQALVDEQLADAPRFGMCRRASELLRHGAYPAQRDTPDSVAGVELGLLCGIANPASLRRSVEELGGVIVAERLFADHHRYRARDLRGLAELAPRWITTEKDAVKILPAWSAGVDLRVLRSELEAEPGEGLIDWVERRIAASASLRPAS